MEIVLAAFKVSQRNSLAYRRYRTVEGFQEGVGRVIRELEPDYISVRIVKEVAWLYAEYGEEELKIYKLIKEMLDAD